MRRFPIIVDSVVTCCAIWGLLDKDNNVRAWHGLLNTERLV